MSLHGHDPSKEVGRAGYITYLVGLALAILLTLIAFNSVTESWLPPAANLYLIVGAAIAQIMVHTTFFLHMTRKSTPFWNAIIFFFMLIVVVLLVTGTMFIMLTATHNMMPPMNLE